MMDKGLCLEGLPGVKTTSATVNWMEIDDEKVNKGSDICVLMCLYKNDKGDLVKMAIDSILRQTVKPEKIILVIDGPVDSNVENFVYHELPSQCQKEAIHLMTVKLAKNTGLHNALNRGLQYVDCKYIARMDSDDICVPERFEKQKKILEMHDADVVYSSSIEFEKDLEHPFSINRAPNENKLKFILNFRNPIVHPSVFMKACVLKDVGGYRDAVKFEDYDLYLRLLKKGYKLKGIYEPLLYFRVNKMHRIRREGWRYCLLGIRYRIRWSVEGLVNPLLSMVSIIPFVIFAVGNRRLKEFVYFILREAKK